MTLMRRPSMIPEFDAMRDSVERFFGDSFLRPWWFADGERAKLPALDLYTTPESVVAQVALPGIKPEDLDIQVSDGTVSVSGTMREEQESKDTGYVQRELIRGTFSRSFTIPVEADAERATATYSDGILTLTLPRVEATKPRHITVEVK